MKEKAPAVLYKERSLSVRSIRDYFTSDVSEILIDDDAVFNEVKGFVHIISPKHKRIVKRYTADRPIFTKHQLEDQITTIFENRVSLKSGRLHRYRADRGPGFHRCQLRTGDAETHHRTDRSDH
jgi:ribonuclease E